MARRSVHIADSLPLPKIISEQLVMQPGQIWEAIGKLKEEGLSILLVEQSAHLALKLVDYVHVMSKGQVVYSGRPEALKANDEIKSSYLGI